MKVEKLYLDFESRSAADLPVVGAHVYARHPTTEILCAAWAIEDGEIKIWKRGEPAPAEIFAHIKAGKPIWAHNANFERLIWQGVGVEKYGWPVLPDEQLFCTMVECYNLGLPGSLEMAAKALNLDLQKDDKGRRVMLQLSKPRSIDEFDRSIFWEPETPSTKAINVPEKFEILYKYCKNDVAVERAIGKKVMRLTQSERKTYLLDQKINDRGIAINGPAARAAAEVAKIEQKRLLDAMKELTGGSVSSLRAPIALKNWVNAQGAETTSVNKAAVRDLMEKKDLPEKVRQVLVMRREAAKSSTAKFEAMISGMGADGRVRGCFQYYGGYQTGRFAGRRVQFHNIPRPTMPQVDIEKVVWLLGDPELSVEEIRRRVDVFFGSPMQVLSDCLRAMLVPGPGNKFVCRDFSQIEARVIAWLAGQEDVLDVFRGHGKLYEATAAKIYNVPIDKVTKEQRLIGKVAVLALGFQGGVRAFQKMAPTYGVKVEDAFAKSIVERFRASNKKIVKLWFDYEAAAVKAVQNPGLKVSAGAPGRQVTYLKSGSFLFCRLPSGRSIVYAQPKIVASPTPWGEVKDAVEYLTENGMTRQLERVTLYGGLQAENCFAGNVRVFTNRGLVKFKSIKATDKIWDGENFVSHDGLLKRGKKEVVKWCGILATKEHKITNGKSWLKLGEMGENDLQKCLAYGQELAPLSWKNRWQETIRQRFAGAIAAGFSQLIPECFIAKRGLAPRAVESLGIKKEWKNFLNLNFFLTPFCAPNGRTFTPGFCRGVTTQNQKFLKITGAEALKCTSLGEKIQAFFTLLLSRCQTGIIPRLSLTGLTTTGVIFPITCESLTAKQTQEIEEKQPSFFLKASNTTTRLFAKLFYLTGQAPTRPGIISTTEKRPSKLSKFTRKTEVYDLKNCGPNNRYMILTERGPVVAHNCTQAVARDIMVAAMHRLETSGFPIVFSAHDEIMSEVPIERHDDERMTELMTAVPEWAQGLPIGAAGWSGFSYRKE